MVLLSMDFKLAFLDLQRALWVFPFFGTLAWVFSSNGIWGIRDNTSSNDPCHFLLAAFPSGIWDPDKMGGGGPFGLPVTPCKTLAASFGHPQIC